MHQRRARGLHDALAVQALGSAFDPRLVRAAPADLPRGAVRAHPARDGVAVERCGCAQARRGAEGQGHQLPQKGQVLSAQVGDVAQANLGLPDFAPVQNNVSFNVRRGATRGIHAEPWDKMVSVATGRIFGAWVDLRAGESFGRVVTLEMGPETAVFVPRGVGNSYQTLEDATSYSYLVNDHWSPDARSSYTFVNLADPSLAIPWPITQGPSRRGRSCRVRQP